MNNKTFTSKWYIQVPRQKHFKNNTKIARFKRDIKRNKKEVYFYKIYFKNNIFIIKQLNDINDINDIKQYITKIELYSKIIIYNDKTYKKLALVV